MAESAPPRLSRSALAVARRGRPTSDRRRRRDVTLGGSEDRTPVARLGLLVIAVGVVGAWLPVVSAAALALIGLALAAGAVGLARRCGRGRRRILIGSVLVGAIGILLALATSLLGVAILAHHNWDPNGGPLDTSHTGRATSGRIAAPTAGQERALHTVGSWRAPSEAGQRDPARFVDVRVSPVTPGSHRSPATAAATTPSSTPLGATALPTARRPPGEPIDAVRCGSRGEHPVASAIHSVASIVPLHD